MTQKKSIKEKELQGTLRKNRLNNNQLKFDKIKKRPVPPAGIKLGKVATKLWNLQCENLIDKNILSKIDLIELSVWAIEMERYYKCKEIIDKEGEIFKTPNGYSQQRPEVSIMKSSFKIAHDIADNFGFNPSSRDKITIDPDIEENKLTKLMNM